MKYRPDSDRKFSETDILQMLFFLIDNLFVTLREWGFQQTTGIPIGTNIKMRAFPVGLKSGFIDCVCYNKIQS